MNIGITLGLTKDNESMWVNGIKLNAIFLANVFKNLGHTVWLLDTSGIVDYDKKTGLLNKDKIVWDIEEFPIYYALKKWKEVDVLFTLGTALDDGVIKHFRKFKKSNKVVKYMCGNNYVIDMERMIFPKGKRIESAWTQGHDEAWYIPQQEYHNKHYYATIGRLPTEKVKVVPFVWSPDFIKNENEKCISKGLSSAFYTPGKSRNEKNLISMEPNMNVVKFCLPLIMIAEKLYRKLGKESFNEFWIGSGKTLLKNSYFLGCIKNLDITTSNKLKMCSRYPVQVFLSEKADVVLSHQWDNPLNYAYLDALYFNYPLIHNASMVKDAGYYYEDFNLEKGATLLEHVLNHHDEFIQEYQQNSVKVLSRYMTKNKKIVETYKKLIENVFEPGKHNLSYEYDWSTNLYK